MTTNETLVVLTDLLRQCVDLILDQAQLLDMHGIITSDGLLEARREAILSAATNGGDGNETDSRSFFPSGG